MKGRPEVVELKQDGLRQNGRPARSSKQQADAQAGGMFGGRQKKTWLTGVPAGWLQQPGLAAQLRPGVRW